MKLLTELGGYAGDIMVIYDADHDLMPDEQVEHDAAAAHALLRAIDEWADMPLADAINYNSHDWIKQRATELMREWGFKEQEVE